MKDLDPTTIIVALLGAGGIGAFIRDLIDTLAKLATGRSASDQRRRLDIVQARDEALEREADERERADVESRNRRQWEEYAFRLRRLILQSGAEPPSEPVTEQTIPRSELRASDIPTRRHR